MELNIFSQCEDILGLKKPVNILFKPKMKGANGKYWSLVNSKGKLVQHLIHISRDIKGDIRTLEELIIHEYIHAWQAENDMKDNHGLSFQSWAKFPIWKIIEGNKGNIWIPKYDGYE